MKRTCILLFILSRSVFSHAQLLSQHVIATSGAAFSSSGYFLDETVGEMSAIETYNAVDYILSQGFQQGSLLFIGIDEPGDQLLTTEIYPNPASGFIEVKFEQSSKISLLEITDVLGNRLWSGPPDRTIANNIFQVKLSGFAAGMYFLRINLSDQSSVSKTITKTFIIQH